MNTTLLFAELLIIGLQSSLWLFALTLVVFGDSWLQQIQTTGLADWQTIMVITLLSFLYVLGILVDRVADSIFARWDGHLRNQLMPSRSLPMNAIRFKLGLDNEYLNRHLEYMRSRIRIARASSINFALTTMFVVLFVQFRLQRAGTSEMWSLLAFAFIFGVTLELAAVYAWHKLSKGYYHVIKVNYGLLEAKQEREHEHIRLQRADTSETRSLLAFASMFGVTLALAAVYCCHKLSKGYYHVIKGSYGLLEAKQEREYEHMSDQAV